MQKYFRGEATYTAETDIHFPKLTVGTTLQFAASARFPRLLPEGLNPSQYAIYLRDVVMAMVGIGHTKNTKVGNDFVRGVSGGERKRVSIAEIALSGAPLQCWDNSTRGLDSANSIEFCKTLRMSADVFDSTMVVAIYQAPQAAYDQFDKVTLLYEGRQVFYGRTSDAQRYFEGLGFECPDRQTTPDFLTSMTNPVERIIRPGYENMAPRNAKDFEKCWKDSDLRREVLNECLQYEQDFIVGGTHYEEFIKARQILQAKNMRFKSPYTISYFQQVKLCLWRGFHRLISDPSLSLTQLGGNFILALVLGSIFFNMKDNSKSFYGRGGLIFFSLLFNAFSSTLEVLTLYEQRPIVEKHKQYAFYHPSAEAISSMLTDIPYKVVNAFTFNITLYFMANLKREAGPFFFFILVSFMTTLVLSSFFRSIASISRTISQAMVPVAILILWLVMFSGFIIPATYMLGWSRWMNYLNPMAYAFESLMVNEFSGRNFSCSTIVPSGSQYDQILVTTGERSCSAAGSTVGSLIISGDAVINQSFDYFAKNKWRNVGIMGAFLIGFTTFYLVASEYISAKKSNGEVLLFRRGKNTTLPKNVQLNDIEHQWNHENPTLVSQQEAPSIETQSNESIFHWEDLCYDVKIKGESRRILDHVDGWVQPGTLTALMGVSGAGKTTLLDTLATRITMGVVTGSTFINGATTDDSFQRKTGYVQQQDIHLSTSTVREALMFSAVLRQPRETPYEEKTAYVDEVIGILGMEEYADAVVGVPGEGLNVEQRKRLTIGIELAAKPQLLLFLDEPTSGLDSQTSWSICDLLKKLTDRGQAILCTVHQPSAKLFQRFDRLLLLAKGGRTVYFGDVGENSGKLIDYFESHGAPMCTPDLNPAEWMLTNIGATPGIAVKTDWYKVWLDSTNYREVKAELARLRNTTRAFDGLTTQNTDMPSTEFAAPFWLQYWEVQKRVAAQYWRTPNYIYSKLCLCTLVSLYIGFSFFKAKNTVQGLQNQMYSIFMILTIFGQLAEQIMPLFVTQRALFEVREQPSKVYSWKAFMISNILIEIAWNSICAVLMYFCYYYPTGLYRNAEPTNEVSQRGFMMFLFLWCFMLLASTFTHFIISAVSSADTAGNIANLLFTFSLAFCGVVVPKDDLPGFWIFMYRASPFTYLVGGLLSVGVANSRIICAANEYVEFVPPLNTTCGSYMETYLISAGGYILNPDATEVCSYCKFEGTNQYLKNVAVEFDERWRNFGLLWIYIGCFAAGAYCLYWTFRVPSNKRKATA